MIKFVKKKAARKAVKKAPPKKAAKKVNKVIVTKRNVAKLMATEPIDRVPLRKYKLALDTVAARDATINAMIRVAEVAEGQERKLKERIHELERECDGLRFELQPKAMGPIPTPHVMTEQPRNPSLDGVIMTAKMALDWYENRKAKRLSTLSKGALTDAERETYEGADAKHAT